MHTKRNQWQYELANAVTEAKTLVNLLELEDKWLAPAEKAAQLFPLKVPHSFIQRMEKQNPYDPLLLQVLPLQEEFHIIEGFNNDPVKDIEAMKIPGLLQKYQARVLLITTGACAIHCRYCFRRHYPYQSQNIHQHWSKILDIIKQDSSIEEVIFSGGDPFSLTTQKLTQLCKDLTLIPHLERIRFHTRYPIVLPSRIDETLCEWLNSLPWDTIIVIHSNHPQEINEEVKQALTTLKQTQAILLNQTVLLKNINNQLATQIALSKKLVSCGILPYYLHLLDPVTGSSHFQVDLDSAKLLMQQMSEKLSGYLLPTLVQEVPKKAFKVKIV